MCGIYELNDKEVLMWTGLTPSELDDAKNKFQKDGKFKFAKGWVKVVNHMKYNAYGTGEKQQPALEKELNSIPKDTLSLLDSDTSMDTSMDTTPILDINHKEEIRKRKEGECEGGKLPNFEKLSGELGVSIRTVERYFQKIVDYEGSTGKKYKNYEFTIRNWVRRDIDEGKLKITSDSRDHVTTDAEREIMQSLSKGGNGYV